MADDPCNCKPWRGWSAEFAASRSAMAQLRAMGVSYIEPLHMDYAYDVIVPAKRDEPESD